MTRESQEEESGGKDAEERSRLDEPVSRDYGLEGAFKGGKGLDR